MAYWGGATAGGWSHSHFPSGGGRPGAGLKRGTDGWDDEELGKPYDHSVIVRLLPYLKPYRGRVALALLGMLVFAGHWILRTFSDLFIETFTQAGRLVG